MRHTMKNWMAAGAVAIGSWFATTPAQAGHEPIYLTRIAIYEEVGHGRHVAIGNRQLHLTVRGYGNDSFEFEIKGFDQYNRMMPDFAFSPELIFPAGPAFGTLRHLGGHHWRFQTGSIPTADLHLTVRDRNNRNIGARVHVAIAAPPPVVVYEEAPVVVYRQCEPAPRPIGYVIPTPHPVHVVHPRAHHPQPIDRRRAYHRSSGSGFGIRISGGDGHSSFGFFAFGD